MSRRPPFAFALALVLLARTGLSQPADEPSPPLPDLTEEPGRDDASSTPDTTDPTTPVEPPAPVDPAEAPPAAPELESDDTGTGNEVPVTEPPAQATAGNAVSAPGEATSGAPDWRVGVGLRLTFIDSPGFDPFATNDVLPQATFSVGRVLLREDELSLAGVFTFDVGGRSATARGEETSLRALSFALGPEGRYEPVPWARVHVRPSFVVSGLFTSIDESSSQSTLHARDWLFGFEAVAGASADVARLSEQGNARISLLAEAGYAWTTESSLRFRPDGGDGSAPHRSAPLDLGAVVLRGPTVRIAVALTF